MITALRIEATKFARSTVGIVASAAIGAGIVVLCAAMMLAVVAGEPSIVARLGEFGTFDWRGLLGAAAQITSAGAFVGFGVVAAWMYAREFAEGTITGLFAQPIGRATIAIAKALVFLAWAIGVSVLVAGALLLLGFALGFGPPDSETAAALGRQAALGAFTAVLTLPVAWVASLSRSLLAGVATTIGFVVVAQVGVLADIDGWMPLAAPALWALSGGTAASPAQLVFAVAVGIAALSATAWSWHRLQLDR
ncbi:hypothetical protein GCM10022200_16590 [Microbacterium awajiense]|uniref:ABC transporter permease n=1 Tax=Microbacterium awajiense TaxID=415214 RepID=A0ABP7AJM9_9MICO